MIRILFAIAFTLVLAACATNPTTQTLRVMTYNIHHGEGVDGKLDLERIAKLITETKLTWLLCRKSIATRDAPDNATCRRNWQS
jgi:hypothetical protein